MNATDVSQLLVDYLSHADSIAAGVPDNDALRKRSIAAHKEPRPPSLLIHAALTPDNRAIGKAVFDLTLELKAPVGKVEETRPQLEAWMKAIKDRIRERAEEDGPEYQVFADWVQANRTELERTGWQIAQLKLLESEEEFKADEETLSLGSPAMLTLWVD